MVIQISVYWRRNLLSTRIDSAVATKWETSDKAVKPRNRSSYADLFESNDLTLRVLKVDVLVYLFLALVFSLQLIKHANRKRN